MKNLNQGHPLSVCYDRGNVTWLSSQRPGFNPRPVCVIFVVEKEVLEQVYSWVLLFSPVLTFIWTLFWPEGQRDDGCECPEGNPVANVRELVIQKHFHFFFRPHEMWHCNRICSQNLDLPPSLSFHQCFILILILLLLYQKGELVKPGHLQKAMLFPKITEHWIEKYFFSYRPCRGWGC